MRCLHGLIKMMCAYCCGKDRADEMRSHTSAKDLAFNGGSRWTRGEVSLLMAYTADLEIGTPKIRGLFKSLANEFGRTYQAVYDKWAVETGHSNRIEG